MPFAPFDFFVPIKANILVLGRGLDALAIGTACGRFGQTALALPFPPAQRVHQLRPEPLTPPAPEIAIDGVPIAQVGGHHAPLAPGFVDVENTINDASECQGLPSWTAGTPLRLG